MPIDFNYGISGGSGMYTWGDIQTFIVNEMITLANGTTIDKVIYGSESLGQDPAGSTHGSTVTYYDAPGLSTKLCVAYNLNGKCVQYSAVLSATVTYSFTLQVQAYSVLTGQFIDCPTVYWDAALTWTTQNGKPVVSGGITGVTTQLPNP
jgi:hypothetical protein